MLSSFRVRMEQHLFLSLGHLRARGISPVPSKHTLDVLELFLSGVELLSSCRCIKSHRFLAWIFFGRSFLTWLPVWMVWVMVVWIYITENTFVATAQSLGYNLSSYTAGQMYLHLFLLGCRSVQPHSSHLQCMAYDAWLIGLFYLLFLTL